MFKELLDRFIRRNTLYYPGCLTHFVLPEIEENYRKILKRIGVDFISPPEISCCGSPVKHAGYAEEFKRLSCLNREDFEKYGIGRIITNCPACYVTLKEIGIEVEHISQVIEAGVEKLGVRHNGEITYHDPCHLGRQGGIYDEPRSILRKIGFDVVELQFCREESLCCGGGAGMKSNYPEMSNKIAKSVLEMVRTEKLITPCPLCYLNFRENSQNIEILEFSQVLL